MKIISSIKEALRQRYLKLERDKTPPQYVIEQPGDLLHVPADKLHLCLAELEDCLTDINNFKRMGAMGGKSALVMMKRFVWIDDGENNKHIGVES